MSIIKLHGIDTKIDDDMVLLVKELNRLGLKTISSCSGHDDGTTILFAQIAFSIKNVDVFMKDDVISLNWKR